MASKRQKKKKAKRQLTPTQQAYYRNRERIQSFIRKASKRGYQFQANILPAIPKKITPASVRRLEKINPEYLYGKSIYAVGLDVVSGREGRKIERARAIEKRRENKLKKIAQQAQQATQEQRSQADEWTDEQFYEWRKKQDEIDRQNAQNFSYAIRALEIIEDLIDQYPVGGKIMRKLLGEQLSLYGREDLIYSISKAPEEFLSLAQDIIYYESDKENIYRAIVSMYQLLSGEQPDEQARRDIEEELESGGYGA